MTNYIKWMWVMLLLFSLPSFAQITYYAPAGLKVGEEIYFQAPDVYLGIDSIEVDWDFGDGMYTGKSGGVVFVHTYNFPGNYLVKLFVDEKAVDSIQLSIESINRKFGPIVSYLPVLELNFDGNVKDELNDVEFEWSNGVGNYVTGVQGQALDLSAGSFPFLQKFTGLDSASAFTLSFWFKRNNVNSDDFVDLLQFEEVATVYMRSNGQAVNAIVKTDEGSANTQNWYIGFDDTGWKHFVIRYDGVQVQQFLNGRELVSDGKCPKALTGVITREAGVFRIGCNVKRNEIFNGCIDELKIYDRALSKKEIFGELELWHADFHSRIAQYIEVHIPQLYQDNNYNIQISLNKGNQTIQELLAKSELSEKETFLLKRGELNAGNYTISTKILNTEGQVVNEVKTTFQKKYDGIPYVGIDENNAIRLNGELFFPVTPFGLNIDKMSSWQGDSVINLLYNQGFWPREWTPEEWTNYLDKAADYGWPALGPGGSWKNKYVSDRNADVRLLESYINISKNEPHFFGHHFDDEPELGGPDMYIPAEVIRAWTNKAHRLDSLHPVITNLVGPFFMRPEGSYGKNLSKNYCYTSNQQYFGKRTFVTDIYGMDFYPIDWGAPHSKKAKISDLAFILDEMIQLNNNMVPCFSFVETCNIKENDVTTMFNPTPWHPTPEMLKMLIWVNVVHGVKGLNWFPYHTGTPDCNIPVMQEFYQQITQLTPVVLGAEVSDSVSVFCTGGEKGEGRVDVLLKKHKNQMYVFAVRVSELEGQANAENATEYNPTGHPDPVQNYPVTTTFSIPGLNPGEVEVLYENRSLQAEGNQFVDVFEPYQVHIYRFNLPTSNKEDLYRSTLNVFPNPAYTDITLQFSGESEPFIIELFDCSGEKVFENTFIKSEDSAIKINIQKLEKGVYVGKLSQKMK